MFNYKSFRLIYGGSVKNLWEIKRPTPNRTGVSLFEFTDDYSIFDYGKMPDRLNDKGRAMAVLSAYLFERLEEASLWDELANSSVWAQVRDKKFRERLLRSDTLKELRKNGLKTHYRCLRDKTGRRLRSDQLKEPTNLMEMDSARIFHPIQENIMGKNYWNYNLFSPALNNYLIPLECVFRLGLPEGSSIFSRLDGDPSYHRILGLKRTPRPNTFLSRPVVEYFTKLEPSDRYLSVEMALNVSGLSSAEFQRMMEYTFLGAIFLNYVFRKAGLRLWDGKFEYIIGPPLMLGDAITPDELRITKGGIQVSKEPIRQYYRRYEKAFYQKVKEAKRIVEKEGGDTRKVLHSRLDYRPPRLSPDFKKTVKDMYTAITVEVTGYDIFPHYHPLSDVINRLNNFSG